MSWESSHPYCQSLMLGMVKNFTVEHREEGQMRACCEFEGLTLKTKLKFLGLPPKKVTNFCQAQVQVPGQVLHLHSTPTLPPHRKNIDRNFVSHY